MFQSVCTAKSKGCFNILSFTFSKHPVSGWNVPHTMVTQCSTTEVCMVVDYFLYIY